MVAVATMVADDGDTAGEEHGSLRPRSRAMLGDGATERASV
jgi:hypothetical protein